MDQQEKQNTQGSSRPKVSDRKFDTFTASVTLIITIIVFILSGVIGFYATIMPIREDLAVLKDRFSFLGKSPEAKIKQIIREELKAASPSGPKLDTEEMKITELGIATIISPRLKGRLSNEGIAYNPCDYVAYANRNSALKFLKAHDVVGVINLDTKLRTSVNVKVIGHFRSKKERLLLRLSVAAAEAIQLPIAKGVANILVGIGILDEFEDL